MSGAKVLVMGAGGIGGITAALLTEAGYDVTAVTTNPEIHARISEHGYELCGRGSKETRLIRGKVSLGVPSHASPYDFVLLATQPPQVEEAARTAEPLLAPTGRMVCFQNGLCEDRVATIVGRERVLGGVVAWGAAMKAPGVYDRTAQGGFTLGRLAGLPTDDRAAELATILKAVGPVELTDNLVGKRWSKLAINCAISSLGTLGGARVGALLRHRFVRRLGLEVMSEAVSVARGEDVRLEKVSGTIDLDWVALTEGERQSAGSPSLVAKHALLLAVGFRYRRMRSSMLSAIERGRPPAVDFLNGEVASRALRRNVTAKVNATIQKWIWEISRGERKSGLDTLRALADETSSPSE